MKQLRADRLSLNGIWQIIFDDENKGKMLNWQEREHFASWYGVEDIRVPSCWEEYRQDYEGAAWYGRTFRVPAEWEGKRVCLKFHAVNYIAEIYINGLPVDSHEGGYTGFEVEIGDLIDYPQDNFLAVRVIGPIITRDITIDGLGRDDMPHWRGAIAGGIWQPVELLASDSVVIRDVFVAPDLTGKQATATIRIDNGELYRQEMNVRSYIGKRDGDKEIIAEQTTCLTLHSGDNEFSVTLPVPDPHAWSPDDPYLYEFTVELADERGSGDAVAVRFGMREFTVSGKHFMLNGEKILLKAVFYEGLYPNTLAYPEDMELVRKEFRLAKEAGINMIRPWRKPQPTPIYELADEMGLLMVGAIPVECMRYWPRLTPYTERRVINEVEQMVQRDRNHASIVIWEMFNEIMRYSLKRIKHKVSLVARKLDPTRIIIDESGGFAGGAHVYLPGGTEPICFNDVHSYPGSPLNADGYDMFLSLGKTPEQMAEMNINQPMRSPSVIEPGLLTNITEIGYGSIPMLEDNVEQYEKTGNPLTPDYRYHRLLLSSYKKVLQSTGVDRIYPDFADFCRECQEIHAIGNKLMTEAARVNPDVSGIGIHAWTDGDWVFGAGLVDLFRNPKKAYYAAKEIFQPLYVAIRAKPSNVRDTDGANVSLTVVNDREPFRGELRVSVRDAAGGVKDERQLSVDVPNGIAKLAELRLDTNGWSGAYTIQAQLIEGDRESTKNEYGIYVLNANAESGAGCGTGSVADAAGATGATGKAGKSLPPIVACFPTESNANVRTFLAAQGCTVVAFDKSMSMDIPFLITRLPQNEAEREKIKPLQDWVGRGGQAIVHLKAPGAMRIDAAGLNVADVHEPDLFPFPVQLVRTRGLWSPANHIVKRHPIFDGLPQDCMMGQPYQNVYPQVSMLAPIGDWIVGFIGYHWYQGSKHRQNYTGIAPAFDAAELIAVPHGQGRYVLSTLRLPEQIGTDPLAKRILTNMLSWIVT